ncbi:hypothetical protein TGRH88_047990 [Toxoplasma gondii]|uniref:Uncharacterized protein n=1 Tax=Toxoplasma gondii TaxID=5811 RepID=A0A7J6K0C6_TOXGO|nr:hypothetical protein TGRH88_047990 [Toxoplasma gondii]
MRAILLGAAGDGGGLLSNVILDALEGGRIARRSRRAVGLLLSSSWNLQPTGSASDGSVTGTEWPMCGIGGFWKPGGRVGALLVLAQRLATRVGRQRPHVEGDGIPIITPCEGGSCRRTARECHGIDDCGSEQFAPSGRRVLAMVDLAQCVGIRLRRQPPSAEGDGIQTTWMHVRASPVAVERGWFGSVAEVAPAFLVLWRLFRLRWQRPHVERDGIPTTWMHVRASPVAVERGWFSLRASAARLVKEEAVEGLHGSAMALTTVAVNNLRRVDVVFLQWSILPTSADSAGRFPGSLKRYFRMRLSASEWRDKWRTRQQTDASEPDDMVRQLFVPPEPGLDTYREGASRYGT